MGELPVHNGTFVPWTMRIGPDGCLERDPARHLEALVAHLCCQCGGDLTVPMVFIGGKLDDRLFDAAPAHPDCARWSVRNLPLEGTSLTLYHVEHYVAVEDDGQTMAYSSPVFSVELL